MKDYRLEGAMGANDKSIDRLPLLDQDVRKLQAHLPSNDNEMGKSFEKMATVLDKIVPIMIELEWPPILDLTVANATQIILEYELFGLDAARCKLEQIILKRYNKVRLQAILVKWQNDDRLAQRLPILRQVIDTHSSGYYFASVTTILPQIEGIIPERYGHKKGDWCTTKKLEKYVKELLATKSVTFLDRWMERFYSEIILKQFTYGDDLKSTLSRHAILHGYDTKYGTQINSLQAILIFDYLQKELYRLVSLPKGKCYHLVGCPIVDANRLDLIIYEHLSLAQISDKRPCKICNPNSP